MAITRPEEFHDFEQWIGDIPEAIARSNSLLLLMDQPRNIVAEFVRRSCVIEVTVVGNGGVAPSGLVIVPEGGNQSFLIDADEFNHIGELAVYNSKVDGVPAVGMLFYTWANILTNSERLL